MTFDFTIRNDPGDFSDDYGLYLMVCFGSISNHNFYFGLQTDVRDRGQGRGRGKGLIFSRWGERDLAFARVADDEDGWYQSSGHEGDFIGVRRSYNWGTGDYRMRLALMAWTTTASGMDCGLPTSAPMRRSGPGH